MIDRYDAPDGYVAVRDESFGLCDGCAFYDINTRRTCADVNGCQKNDEGVIFKTRACFEAMLLQELEQFYGVKITKPVGEVSGVLFFTVENPSKRIRT